MSSTCRSSAPIISPCFYGVDTSTYEELISARMSVSELCAYIGADSLRFMTMDQMRQAIGARDLCLSCFSGKYPTALFSFQSIIKTKQ